MFFQDLSFIRNYTKAPTVVLTAKHSTSGGNAAAECNGIVSWIEVILQTSNAVIAPRELTIKTKEVHFNNSDNECDNDNDNDNNNNTNNDNNNNNNFIL